MAAKFATEPPITAPGNTPLGNTRLWRYAVDTYSMPGVADEMLRLQDECGADVLWLLAALWLASEGVALTPELLHQPGYDAWRDEMILPIRAQRRSCDRSETPDLYEILKKAELEAEREGLYRLYMVFKDVDKLQGEYRQSNLAQILKDENLAKALFDKVRC